MVPRSERQESIDAAHLEYALGSPLRLRLVAELLSNGGVALDDLVLRSGRHRQDVLACLKPMQRWGVVQTVGNTSRFCLHASLSTQLKSTLERVVADRADQLERERRVRHQVLSGMLGIDPKMQLVFEMIRQVARVDVSVLVSGEVGTGKELVARAIHDLSGRSGGRFGAVNCAALGADLFASELFGHVKGAFTGASRDHVGRLERCHRGTLFLDEIGELTPPNQRKLLQFLQLGTFSRLGDGRVRHADFRLISATGRDLRAMVAEGTFSEDLYYRINVFPLRLPSLRERPGDLPYLIDDILRKTPTSVTPAGLERLREHHWPGNLRELEDVVMRAVDRAMGKPIEPRHLVGLEAGPAEQPAKAAERSEDRLPSLAEVECEHIKVVLAKLRGNMRASARLLGVSRTTLYKKVRDYSIDIPALLAARD